MAYDDCIEDVCNRDTVYKQVRGEGEDCHRQFRSYGSAISALSLMTKLWGSQKYRSHSNPLLSPG